MQVVLLTLLLLFSFLGLAHSQGLEKAVIAHNSDSISIAPLIYGIVLQALSDDGMVSQQVLQEFLEQVKKESGVKKQIALTDIVDYRILKEVAKEIETKG